MTMLRASPILALYGCLCVLSLACLPSAELRAGDGPRMSRFNAPTGECYFEFRVLGGSAATATGAPRVSSLDVAGVYVFADAVAWNFEGEAIDAIGCCRGEVPSRFVVERGGRSESLDLDWSNVRPDDAGLPGRWRAAARSHFERAELATDFPAFAQFALSRLAARDGASAGAPGTPTDFLRAQDRFRQPVSTFDLATGAAAIEESLQLERLRGSGRNRALPAAVSIASIVGVTVKSHPWAEMLAGRDPQPHPIERLLPLDQYAFEAASFASLIELADWMDAYGSPLLEWAEEKAEDARVKERLERQLCLPASALARKLGPMVIGRVAATGGDPFLREGSDFTLVFELKAPALFLANLEKNRAAAEATQRDAARTETRRREHTIRGLVTPMREVSSYSAVVSDYAVVSNSLAGLERVLDAHDGWIESQDDGLDRKFVRTLLPRGGGEDAFLFLSDAAIRRLVGPDLKLRESRRLECSASLRTLAHAAAWRHLRGGEPAADIAALLADGDLDRELLFCPDGGAYRLLLGGRAGACSVHGTLEFLTPNAELALERVTSEEKLAYERFRDTYQAYWSRFFDPIGMQVSLGADRDGKRVRRFETVILPLIEMSEYRQLAELFGGKGVQKGPLVEAGGDTTLVISAHLDRESELFRFGSQMLAGQTQGLGLGWIGDRVSVFARDLPEGKELPDDPDPDLFEELFESLADGYPGGVRISVQNRLLLAGFLAGVQSFVHSSAPGVVRFETLPEHDGVSVVKVAPVDRREGERGPGAFYYAVVGDGLYLALDLATVHQAIERQKGPQKAGGPAPGTASAAESKPEPSSASASAGSWIDDTHLALGLDLGGSPRWRKLLLGLYEKLGEEKCAASRARVERMAGLGVTSAPEVHAFYGAAPRCPLGGAFGRDEYGRGVCSHARCSAEAAGPEPAKPPLRDLVGLRASLRFTEDGVRTVLEIEERR